MVKLEKQNLVSITKDCLGPQIGNAVWQIGHQMAISTHVSFLEPSSEGFSSWNSMREELVDARKLFSDEDPYPEWPQ